MPIMDGYDSSQQIRTFLQSKNLAQPVIIAVTGHTGESYMRKAFESGMNGLSSKPIEYLLIKDVLQRLLFIE